MSKGKRGLVPLAEQRYEVIQQHIIDPENSPLPEELNFLMMVML